MPRIRSALLALAFTLASTIGLTAVTATPAHADSCTDLGLCLTIHHWYPDNGYDPVLEIRCDFERPASHRTLAEGQNSDPVCDPNDADQVYNPPGAELWCHDWVIQRGVWRDYRCRDATGWWTVQPYIDTDNEDLYIDIRKD